MKLDILTTGGTIDKVYFDKKSEFEVGEPIIGSLLKSMNVGFEFTVDQLMKIDSLDMTDEHRNLIHKRASSSPSKHLLIIHGTDGMIETARLLMDIQNKTIVLTGALQPAAFTHTDANFNIGCSVSAVQSLPAGIYIVMNGQIFTPDNVVKNLEENRFEKKSEANG